MKKHLYNSWLSPQLASEEAWKNIRTDNYNFFLFFVGFTTPPQHVKRVLDVESGKVCFIVGTVYMDMVLKPNVLEDLAREVNSPIFFEFTSIR